MDNDLREFLLAFAQLLGGIARLLLEPFLLGLLFAQCFGGFTQRLLGRFDITLAQLLGGFAQLLSQLGIRGFERVGGGL